MSECQRDPAEFADLLRATRQFCATSAAYLNELPTEGRPRSIEYAEYYMGDLQEILHREVIDTSSMQEIAAFLEHIAIHLVEAGVLWLAGRGYELAAGWVIDFEDATEIARNAIELYGLVMDRPDAERILLRYAPKTSVAEPMCIYGIAYLQMLERNFDIARSLSSRVVRQFSDAAPWEVARAASLLGIVECLSGNIPASAHYSASSARIVNHPSIQTTAAALLLWLLLSAGQHQLARKVLDRFEDRNWQGLTPSLSWVPLAARIILDLVEKGVLSSQLTFLRVMNKMDSYWLRGVVYVVIAGAYAELEAFGCVGDMIKDGMSDLYMAGVKMHNMLTVCSGLIRVGREWVDPSMYKIKEKVSPNIVERFVS